MADVIDLANVCDLIDYEVSRAVKKMRKDAPEQTVEKTKFCIECDDLIPSERQEWGYKLCVKCAKESERKRSQYAENDKL